MNKLVLLLGFAGLLGCTTPDQEQPIDPGLSGAAAGSYSVTAYIVGGDTLYAVPPILTSAKGGINKLGVDTFFMIVKPNGPDQLTVTTTFWQKGVRTTFAKEVTIKSLDNYYYGFAPAKTYAPTSYESKLHKFTNVIVERAVGGTVRIPPLDAAAPIGQSGSAEVTIVAKRQSTDIYRF